MKKGLMSMLGLIAATSMFINSAGANHLEEIKKLTLYEQVNQYLNTEGFGKEEYKSSQYLYRSRDDVWHFNRTYSFDGEKYIEQYDFTGFSEKDTVGGELQEIHPYPLHILWRGQVYLNPGWGVDGDETLINKKPKPNIPPTSAMDLEGTKI